MSRSLLDARLTFACATSHVLCESDAEAVGKQRGNSKPWSPDTRVLNRQAACSVDDAHDCGETTYKRQFPNAAHVEDCYPLAYVTLLQLQLIVRT